MASTKLIGTAPDQVPTNGDLGDLAFQSKESVEFTGGTGGLSHLDLTAIAKSKDVSAVDVFVYDTSKDSDGGAWRKRTQHTSWYNEPLNTATRGSRREFPAVAVIVVTSTAVTIYDGDDPDLPMWMVFNVTGYNSYLGIASGNQIYAVSMLNGILSVGCIYDLHVIRFLSDNTNRYGTTNISTQHPLPIIGRNDSSGTWYYGITTPNIIDRQVNDVAMTVLPNAPIDAATGLPIPTIAVATNGGVSLIKDDGTVVSQSNLAGITPYCGRVEFWSDTVLAVQFGYNSTSNWTRLCLLSMPSLSAGSTYYAGTVYTGAYGSATNFRESLAPAKFGTKTGLVYFHNSNGTNTDTYADRMISQIGAAYNTGWMPGDIKGAWLSDTTQETVVGTANFAEAFSSDTGAWGFADAATISGGALIIANTASSRATYYTWNSRVAGKQYVAEAVISSNANSGIVGLDDDGAGAGVGGATTYGVLSGTGTITFHFTATASPRLRFIRNSGGPVSIDSFNIYPADQDRSVNNKGLQVFGSITKTPVATGADLVAYSGFSASNYLMQPYNSALDFGTGDFSVSAWVYWTGGVGGQNSTIVCRKDPDSANNWTFQISVADSTLNVYNNGGINLAGGVVPTNTWVNVHLVRRAGVAYLYQNAVQKSSASMTLSVTATTEVYVGRRGASYTAVFGGSLSLIRISATAPSAEQIAKMYNDEKVLFQDNAKATLYGTSDAVTALAYDEDTNLLHVGTSSGRSVFNGLRRVDNTTDAVGACISAAGGMVAED